MSCDWNTISQVIFDRGIQLSDRFYREAFDVALRGRPSRRCRPSVDNFKGEPPGAAPCHLVPLGEEVFSSRLSALSSTW